MTPAGNFAAIEEIANAVLYEGFLLYPYRKSSVKNQHRWHFGTVGPLGGSDRTSMQTECLIEGGKRTVVDIRIRFLQNETGRELSFPEVRFGEPWEKRPFAFPPLEGEVEIRSTRVTSELFRLTCRIRNLSTDGSAMSSTHTMLAVRNGAFVSLMDTPEKYKAAASVCRNQGTWPVLAGREGERSLMLSSPIILYDYPRIAPESRGDFFDGTEIDEMLALRVLTLSDKEREEVRAAADRGRDILDRTESMPREALEKLHGAIRSLRKTRGARFHKGDRVRLHPARNADIFDIALKGKIGIVDAVEEDFESNIHIAVTLEDDPGADLGPAAQIGHRFFFRPEEMEPA